jgi:hypothetical protein
VCLVALSLGLAPLGQAACPGECSAPGRGSPTTECIVEYDGVTFNYPVGNEKQLRCMDGDPACDVDGLANGVCKFSIAACLNNSDSRFPACMPTDVATLTLKNKAITSKKFNPQIQTLQDAVNALGLPTASSVCTAPQIFTVPLKARAAGFKKGKVVLVSKGYTSGGVKDVDKVKIFCEPNPIFPSPSVGYARALQITTQAERIGGELGRSDIGDYLLVNDKIQAAILRPGRHAYNAVGLYGGNLIDADRHHLDGIERDSFEILAAGINLENTPDYTSVTVMNDGTNGMPAVIRATGPDDLLDYINPSTVVNGFAAGAFPAGADDTDLPIDITTDYILAAGASYVKIETTITNTDVGSPLSIYLSEYINGSGQLELFQPVYGFGEPLLTTACKPTSYLPCTSGMCDRCSYVAYTGEDDALGVSYGWMTDVNKTTTFSTSGVTVPLLGQDAIFALLGASPPNFNIAASGMPGDAITFTRYFIVGDGTAASIQAIRNEILGVTTGSLSGEVTSGGLPVADADIAVTTAPFGSDSIVITPPAKNIVTHARTAVDGSYATTLPPGSYTVDVNKDGRDFGAPVAAPVVITAGGSTTQDFTLPAPGRLEVTVTDQNGSPSQAKVQVIGVDPSPDPLNTQTILGAVHNVTGVFGDRSSDADGLPFGVVQVGFAGPSGTVGLDVEPGTYQVAVSRGPRYSGFTQTVMITEGATTNVAAQIALVVPTPGYISGDWHVHSINSADCEVTNEERVITELAEGMDFFTPSDHEVRVDFSQTVADLGLGALIGVAPSAEITTFDYGHFNSWPVTVDPSKLNGGSVDHGRVGSTPGMDFPSYGSYALSPAEIFAAAHADPKANLVQINHMHSFFDTSGLDIDTAEAGTGPPQSHTPAADRRLDPAITNFFDSGFDALEVWIGTNGRNGITGDFLGGNLGDWVNLLNQNILRTGVTSSDTHQRVTTQINARSYVASSVTDPALLAADPEALAAQVVAGRVSGTNGPFVRITSSATSTGETGGLDAGLPTLISTTDGAVDITVTVKSPLWAEFDQIQFLVNNAPQPYDHDGDASTRDRYRVIPDFVRNAGADFAVTTVNDYPMIPGASHLEATATLNLTGLTNDVWVIALVRGTDGVSHPLFPFYPNSLDQGSNTTLADLTDGNLGEGGMTALAYTNPLYVDVDGGGWTAPGVMLTP